MSLPTIWQNDAFRTFLREAGYTNLQWNDGLKDYLVFILSASPTLTLNDLLKLYYNTFGTWEIQFTPDDLFILGQYGLWWDFSSTTYITQDSLGTIAVTGATDPVGLVLDRSFNGNDGIQATTSLKPLYAVSPSRIVFDKADDILEVTLSSDINGSLVMGTSYGTIHCDVNIPVGLWGVPVISTRFPLDNIIELFIRDGEFSSSELVFIIQHLITKGSSYIYAPIGSLDSAFATRSDIINIYSSDWNMSGVTNLQSFIGNCPNLLSIDVSNWDVSNVTTLGSFALFCTNLQVLNVTNWNTANVTDISGFAGFCPSLTELNVGNWLVGSVLNAAAFIRESTGLIELDLSNWNLFDNLNCNRFAFGCTQLENIIVGEVFDYSLCTSYVDSFRDCALNQESVDNILISINNAGTNGGTLGVHGGTNATPSVIGKAATDALRARGWTVTLNGY